MPAVIAEILTEVRMYEHIQQGYGASLLRYCYKGDRYIGSLESRGRENRPNSMKRMRFLYFRSQATFPVSKQESKGNFPHFTVLLIVTDVLIN